MLGVEVVTALIGVAGALIGGGIGAWGNYSGAIEGAKRNNEYNLKQKERVARRLLVKQLEITVAVYSSIGNTGNYFLFRNSIYDEQWRSHVGDANLSLEEFNNVVGWYLTIIKIERHYAAPGPSQLTQNSSLIVDLMNYKPNVDNIVQKYRV